MSFSRLAAVALLSVGLAACESDGEIQGSPDNTGRVVRADTQTELDVALDLPADFVASKGSVNRGLQFVESTIASALHAFAPEVFAAPVPGAGIVIAYVGSDGLVLDVLTEEDGLVVNDNGDGSYQVIMPDDLRVDGMVVANPGGGVSIEKGYELPDGSFYAPAVDDSVVISPDSTAATRVAINYIDSFAGISPAELDTILSNLMAVAADLTAEGGLSVDELTTALDGGFSAYIINALLQAKGTALEDASGYVGNYKYLSYQSSVLTGLAGESAAFDRTITRGDAAISITPAVDPEAPLDVGQLSFNLNTLDTTSGFGRSSFLDFSGSWAADGYDFTPGEIVSANNGASSNGLMTIAIPTSATLLPSGDELRHEGYNLLAYGSHETVGALIAGARVEVTQYNSDVAIAEGLSLTHPEILIRKELDYDIESVTGRYGVLYHLRDTSGDPLVVKRGIEKYQATNGSMLSIEQYTVNNMSLSSAGLASSAGVTETFGNVDFVASLLEIAALEGGYGGLEMYSFANDDSKLIHSQIGSRDSRYQGYATAIRLPESIVPGDLLGKTFEILGHELSLKRTSFAEGALEGTIRFSDVASKNVMGVYSYSESTRFEALLDGVNAAEGPNGLDTNVGFITSLDVSTDGEITFTSNDRYYSGFIQEGGNLIVLHSEQSSGTPGASDFHTSDYLIYAVCSSGCKSVPDGQAFDISVTTSGLAGELQLQLNAEDPVAISADGYITLPTPLSYGEDYLVEITTQPLDQTCSVLNGTGAAFANVTDVQVQCLELLTVGGNVSGLSGSVILALNGVEDTTEVLVDGAFNFTKQLAFGSAYDVTVATQPTGQQCSVAAGSGSLSADVSDVAVSCLNLYAVSGLVAGLTGEVGVTLNGSETITLSADGPVAFTTTIVDGASYEVTISQQPLNQQCELVNASGVISADVSDLQVNCLDIFTVGGSVSGLVGSLGLAYGSETITINADGAFTFTEGVVDGSGYSVSISSVPAAQSCSLTNETGTASGNVADILVTCVNEYTVGGTVSGLSGSLDLGLGGETLNIAADGSFVFVSTVSQGADYLVSVVAQPVGQTCTVSAGSGTALANVSNVTVACGINNYTLGGSISGLTGTISLSQGAETKSFTATSSFVFDNTLTHGSAYNVTIATQPVGQTCSISSNSGTATANVSTVNVNCSGNTYTVSGNMTGLASGSVSLLNNGETLVLNSDGAFSFTNTVAHDGTYNVSVSVQPGGQTCNVVNGSGNATGPVTVTVNCGVNSYPLNGTLSGLSGTLELSQGGESLSLTTDGAFSFVNPIVHGAAYSVAVASAPAGQNCVVSNGAGTALAAVTNITVVCTDKTYTLSGTLSGLSGSIVLAQGAETLPLSADGGFAFVNKITHGASYSVSINTQPDGQTCSVSNGSGSMLADVSNVTVSCNDKAYTIGGNVSGLSGTVVLAQGGESLPLSADGAFAFVNLVTHGGAYAVSVQTQPTGQQCVLSNGSGTASAAVTDVALVCSFTSHAVNVSVSGLSGSLGLTLDGGETITPSADGSFSFAGTVTYGQPYAVTISASPAGQSCSLTGATGTVSGDATVSASCGFDSYPLSGAVSGLAGTVGLTLDGGETISVSANGGFVFSGQLVHDNAYAVTVSTQPVGQTCSVSNGSGTVSGPVSDVAVTCQLLTYSVSGTVSGLAGTIELTLDGGDTQTLTADGAFAFTTPVTHGIQFAVAVLSKPAAQTCSVANGSGAATADITNVTVTCATNDYAVSGTVNGVVGEVVLQLNGSNDQPVSVDGGAFAFTDRITDGGSYNVTVSSNPVGQLCTVTSGSGTASADVTGVTVNCVTATYQVSGTLSGLVGSVSLTLDGANTLPLTSNGAFTFGSGALITHGNAYTVAVGVQPSGQTCTVTNASGTAAGAVSNVLVTCSYDSYELSGSIAGLVGTVGLSLDGGATQNFTGSSFTFGAGAITHANPYVVTVATPPTGQTCLVVNGSGTVSAAVSNVQINCSNIAYSVGGSVSGLSGTVVLSENGVTKSISANGAFSLDTTYAYNDSYTVSVSSQPSGQQCNVSSATGTLTANVTDILVTCNDIPYTVGGSVSGLDGTLVLEQGGETLSVSANGSFTFVNTLVLDAAYAVAINTQPAGQSCSLTAESGTVSGNVTTVAVSCSYIEYSVSGMASGLSGSATLNIGGADLVVTADGAFNFVETFHYNDTYNIALVSEPLGQDCVVGNGSATVLANVSDVSLSCSPKEYTVSVDVTGLNGSITLGLAAENILADSNTTHVFTTKVVHGALYTVTLAGSPAGQECSLSNASGTATSDVADVAVNCVDLDYTVGGSLTGLTGSLSLSLGAETLVLNADGSFSFASVLNYNNSYNVSISAQPVGQSCTVSNGSGVVSANVTDIAVSCGPSMHTIAGSISGLSGTVGLSQNGDVLSVSSNGAFVFSQSVAYGGSYSVVVSAQPVGQTCVVSAGSGSPLTGDVSDVSVSCTDNYYSLSGTASGVTGPVTIQLNGGNDLIVSANGAFSFVGSFVHGTAYTATVSASPADLQCSIGNATGTLTANVSNLSLSCLSLYSVGGNASGVVGTPMSGVVQNLILQINGGETVSIGTGGSFNFPTSLLDGSAYSVAIIQQPIAQNCAITSGNGTVNADVTSISVTCTDIWYTIKNKYSGRCARRNGTNVDTTGCSTSDTAFRWKLIPNAGKWNFINLYDGAMCADDSNTSVITYACQFTNGNQIWNLGGSGDTIEISGSNRNFCWYNSLSGGNVYGTSGNCGLGNAIKWGFYRAGAGGTVNPSEFNN